MIFRKDGSLDQPVGSIESLPADSLLWLESANAEIVRKNVSWNSFVDWLSFETLKQNGSIEVRPAWPSPISHPMKEIDAAVLVLVFNSEAGPEILYTRRNLNLRSHSGQVSFCGGRKDINESPIETALREANEEVGLNINEVKVIGSLDTISTVSGEASIVPILSTMEKVPATSPNPDEVSRVFSVPITDLYDPANYHVEYWSQNKVPIHFFSAKEEVIWGATAKITLNLLKALASFLFID